MRLDRMIKKKKSGINLCKTKIICEDMFRLDRVIRVSMVTGLEQAHIHARAQTKNLQAYMQEKRTSGYRIPKEGTKCTSGKGEGKRIGQKE